MALREEAFTYRRCDDGDGRVGKMQSFSEGGATLYYKDETLCDMSELELMPKWVEKSAQKRPQPVIAVALHDRITPSGGVC
jgi:hypothetical protein